MRPLPTLLLACFSFASSAASAQPFKTELKSADADFSYQWPAEVSAMPALVKRFRADMREQRAATIAGGKEFNAMRSQMGGEPMGYMHSTEITTAGQSSRLLSLRIDVSEFTGGAHGNHGTGALIWDRTEGREVKVAALFQRRSNYEAALRPVYCRKLDAERIERRGGDGKIGGGISEFDSCPKLSELAIFPVDEKRDGRFEAFRIVASPYVAGPYVEGSYDVDVPVTAALIRMLNPAFQASFEAQRQ
jgi:hypothetical protein